MTLTTTHWIGLGGAAALLTYMLWPKKAHAAEPAKPAPVTTTPPGTVVPPIGFPPLPTSWPTTPTPPPGWTIPAGWVPPPGWVPPWASPTTPKEAGGISDDYKLGYNAGMIDASAYGSKSMTVMGGGTRDTAKYASSPSYKSGYDQGWHDYMLPISTAGVGSSGLGGMPRQWWHALPRATAADFGMVSGRFSSGYSHPWYG